MEEHSAERLAAIVVSSFNIIINKDLSFRSCAGIRAANACFLASDDTDLNRNARRCQKSVHDRIARGGQLMR